MYKRLNLFDTNVSTGFMISIFLAAHAPETENSGVKGLIYLLYTRLRCLRSILTLGKNTF